jgi:hypothetical protein
MWLVVGFDLRSCSSFWDESCRGKERGVCGETGSRFVFIALFINCVFEVRSCCAVCHITHWSRDGSLLASVWNSAELFTSRMPSLLPREVVL